MTIVEGFPIVPPVESAEPCGECGSTDVLAHVRHFGTLIECCVCNGFTHLDGGSGQ